MQVKWELKTTDILLAFITVCAIPWVTWSTKTLFELKQDIALIKTELHGLSGKAFSLESSSSRELDKSAYFCKYDTLKTKSDIFLSSDLLFHFY